MDLFLYCTLAFDSLGGGGGVDSFARFEISSPNHRHLKVRLVDLFANEPPP